MQKLLIILIFLMILIRYHALVNVLFNMHHLAHHMMVDQVKMHYQIY
jgi:hypothetical protein